MAESLLGLGDVAQGMINLGQLEQMRQRTALIQEDRQLDRERMQVYKQRVEADERMSRVARRTELLKNPLIHGTPAELELIQDDLRDLGLTAPPKEELLAGRRLISEASRVTSDRNATPDQKQDAWMKAFAYSPELTKQALTGMEQAAQYDEKRYRAVLELQAKEGQIRKLNNEQNGIELRQNAYSTIGGMMNRLVDVTNLTDTEGKRSFGKTFQALLNAKSDAERTLLLSPMRDLDTKVKQQASSIQQAFAANYDSMNRFLRPIASAVEQAQAEGKEVDPQDLAKVKTLELLDNAKESVDAWVGNPYDKKHWNRLNTTLQQVKLAAAETKKELAGVESTRQGMLENAIRRTNLEVSKEERNELNNRATSYAQSQFLSYISQGMSDNAAALRAKKDADKQFPKSSVSTKDLQNLEKKGRIELQLPAGTRADAYETIMAADDVISTTSEIRSIVARNPGVVNIPGAFQRSLAGIGQQLLTVAGQDPMANELLNTKPADEYEALQEFLVFKVARALNGRGVLTEPDVNAARKVVGVMKNIGGAQQLMNKLTTIDSQMLALKKRRQSMLQQGTGIEKSRGSKPVEDMSLDEIMKELSGG